MWLRLALEWYLNPDHLPLLAAREALAAQGMALDLIVPDDHYDGFEALARGEVDLVCNEPLHLVETRDLALRAHGTFFATEGGVLMTEAGLDRLRAGQPVRIASPVSNPTTDGLARDILAGWLGRPLGAGQLSIEAAGFNHVDNIAAGHDGAWLAFANVEGVDARLRDLKCQMVTTASAGLPDFSALELIGRADAGADTQAAISRLIAALDAAIPALVADPAAARALWYRASNTPVSDVADAIVEDTLSRLVAPVRASAARWRPMWHYLATHGGDVVDEARFEAMFSPPGSPLRP
jgi:ABC-type nitrate/sulfonate/bicarbonate transport system substrate-binding protein